MIRKTQNLFHLVMVHCDKRGSEAIIGNWSHIFRFEQGSSANLAHVFTHNIINLEDGTFSIDDIRNNVRGSDSHEPLTQLVTIEQTHNMAGSSGLKMLQDVRSLNLFSSGGKVIPLDWIEELSKVCKEKNLALHMDGARIFNAAEYLKVPVARVARDVDTVCFCLSKNLCCPVGSLLVGNKDFVDKARRFRKALGGGMRQVGFLAAAGLCALDTIVPLLGNDHRHTRQFAEAVDNLKSPIFKVDLKNLHTNILMIKVPENQKKVTALDLSNRLAEVKPIELTDGICDNDHKSIIVKSNCKNLTTLRVVFYQQINDELTELAIKKVIYVMKELSQ